MTYAHLRAHMKKISPPVDFTLKNCNLVIDGRSFFKESYKKSGCQSIFGGEYDRYAAYLKSILTPFIDSNVTCYVIFNGGMEADLERRKEIHQKVIDNVNKIDPDDKDAYCEPIFAKDVWKEVLDELNIKYFVTEHDSWSTIFWVASVLECPILTKNYEYSLRFTNCISPKSLIYNKNAKEITCKIFESKNVCYHFRLKHTLLPLFLTLVDESSVYFKKLVVIVQCFQPKCNIIAKALKWSRWQADGLEETFHRIQEILSEEESEEFFNAYQRNEDICRNSKHSAAVKHFHRDRKNGNDKIPIPYINLICNGIFSGSWVVFDVDQKDAMLAASDIIFYACKYMKFRKDAKITFIGRDHDETCVWNVENSWDAIVVQNEDLFKNFIIEKLPGFDFKILEAVPEECWILIITLVYYYKKTDLNFAYSIILSYVMMGPVSENVGLIKRSNFICPEIRTNDLDKNGLKTNDCVAIIDSMIDLFYVKNPKRLFDRKILHTFAEYQHCLQHMNYLNRLCGKKIKPIVYHKTINATLAYNMFLKVKDISDLNKYFEKRLKKSSVFDCFKRIVAVFEACLQSIEMGIE